MIINKLGKEACIWVLEDEESCRFIYSESIGIRCKLKLFEHLNKFREELSAAEEKPDLIIADIRLHDDSFLKFISVESDLSLLKGIPFIIVSSVDDIDILKKCFEEGAIDYLTKPFSKTELIVKVERALSGELQDDGVVEVDNMKMVAGTEKGVVKLTPKEMQILSVLKHAKGEPVPRDMIVKRVWDSTSVGAKTLDVHLFNLRRKAGNLGLEIKFIRPNSLQLLSDGMPQ